MSKPEIFALPHSALNAFLFADVGDDLNGSALTILSTLARLGKDPWAEATRWTQVPKAEAVNALTENIREMPLCAAALHNAHATAMRLVTLLPQPPPRAGTKLPWLPGAPTLPGWTWTVLIYLGLYLALNGAMVFASHTGSAVPPNPPVTTTLPR